MRVSSTVIVLGLSLYQAFADPVDLSPSAAPINAPNLRGSAPVQVSTNKEVCKPQRARLTSELSSLPCPCLFRRW